MQSIAKASVIHKPSKTLRAAKLRSLDVTSSDSESDHPTNCQEANGFVFRSFLTERSLEDSL